MSPPIDNFFDVTEVDIQYPKDEFCGFDLVYSIEVEARLTYLLPGFDEGDEGTLEKSMEWFDKHSRVEQKTHVIHVTPEDLDRTFVLNMLIGFGVPEVENYMVDEVLGCAKRIADSVRFRNRKVWRMKVKYDFFVVEQMSKD